MLQRFADFETFAKKTRLLLRRYIRKIKMKNSFYYFSYYFHSSVLINLRFYESAINRAGISAQFSNGSKKKKKLEY